MDSQGWKLDRKLVGLLWRSHSGVAFLWITENLLVLILPFSFILETYRVLFSLKDTVTVPVFCSKSSCSDSMSSPIACQEELLSHFHSLACCIFLHQNIFIMSKVFWVFQASVRYFLKSLKFKQNKQLNKFCIFFIYPRNSLFVNYMYADILGNWFTVKTHGR